MDQVLDVGGDFASQLSHPRLPSAEPPRVRGGEGGLQHARHLDAT